MASGEWLDAEDSVARLLNQLGYLGVWPYSFDEQNLARVQVHSVGLVQFFAALQQNWLAQLSHRISLIHDVVDVGQERVRTPVPFELAEISGTVGKQNGLILCCELERRRVSQPAVDMKSRCSDDQKSSPTAR